VVSVIMANYNGAAHLADAIRSIQGQTMRDLEIIVSDDASRDDSVRIVTELMAEDPRIRLVLGERNGGPAAARNRALPLAKGEWIAVMDSDDLMHPERLARLVAAARRDGANVAADNVVEFYSDNSQPPRALLTSCWARDPRWVDTVDYVQLNHFYGPDPALGYLKPLFRASILTAPTARYNETLKIAEDYDLVLRLLHSGEKLRVYPHPLYFYRKHGASLSHRLNENALEAIKTANLRFLDQISGSDQRLAAAVHARMRSIETALAYQKLLEALKAGDWSSSLRLALRKPQAAALLRLPIGVRLRRLMPRRGARKFTVFLRWAVRDPTACIPTNVRSLRAPTPTMPESKASYVADRSKTEQIEVTVCICTFRRPSVLHAIASVAGQKLPNELSLRILVIDNDDAPTSRNMISDYCMATGISVDYRHAPSRNISIARNAALDVAATPWLAFMDDDEHASATWLANLWAARSGANAVFGPSQAIYHEGARFWIKGGDYHSNRPEGKRPIKTGYTSNVLMDMQFVRQHGLRFDTALGRTGGEDTIFFHVMYRRGGVLTYAPDAIVYEDVPLSRTNLRWIVIRRYRAGQVYAMMFHRFDLTTYRRVSWTAPLKVAVCAAMSVAMAFNPSRAMWWLMRGTLHCGVLSYAFGLDIHEEYGTRSGDNAGD
jgi:succinoglycan biosynthesis protein ExoM